VGLATVLWNYSGWDNVGTFAEEVEDPQRNYPRALGITSPLVAAIYLLPLVAGVAVTSDPGAWNESAGWPTIARAAGGPMLGALLAATALVSAWSLFNSQLLSVSRVPYVMARDGWLPFVLARVSSRGIPTAALLASCLVAAALAAFTFENLIVLDVLLYSASVLLEVLALIVLRRKYPDAVRPFRIPGGWPVLTLVVGAPMVCAAALLMALVRSPSARVAFLVALAAMGSGIALYYARVGMTTGGTSRPTRAT
jgi:amino acid transporter